MQKDSFSDFTQSDNVLSELVNEELTKNFAYSHIKREVTKDSTSSSQQTTRKHYVISTMRVERYYSSIREEVSPLADSAYRLLDRQDYVGFFMACGPNYVRSIRRAQEVTAIFTFESSSLELAQQFAAGLRSSRFGIESRSWDLSLYMHWL